MPADTPTTSTADELRALAGRMSIIEDRQALVGDQFDAIRERLTGLDTRLAWLENTTRRLDENVSRGFRMVADGFDRLEAHVHDEAQRLYELMARHLADGHGGDITATGDQP